MLTAGRPDVAVPVLFMRLKSGQLWGAKADARGEVLGTKNPRIFWSGLIRMIQQGKCVPIIGPRVRGRWLPSPTHIAGAWSEEHGYPFSNKGEMTQVAQYLASSQGEDFPRYELLDTLIRVFSERLPEELRPKGRFNTLIELVDAVDLPSAFEYDPDYEPTPEAPMVYHLFGSDQEIDSLVLTEDNHLDFLVRTAAEMERIPNYIWAALSNSALIFSGYGLDDWGFRVIMLQDAVKKFASDLAVKVPVGEGGGISKAIWDLHQAMVQQAMANRVSMIESLGRAASTALGAVGLASE